MTIAFNCNFLIYRTCARPGSQSLQMIKESVYVLITQVKYSTEYDVSLFHLLA